MKSGKHIVWVTPGFAAREQDDAAMPTLQNLAMEFMRSHPEVKLTIVSLHFPLKESEYFWNGIKVHCLGGANVGYPLRFLLWRKARRKLRAIHHETKIDLVHSFWYSESALLADQFAAAFHVPHVCSVMGQDVRPENRYFRLLRNRNFFTVGISARSSELFHTSGGKKVDTIIPMGIEPIHFNDDVGKSIDIIGVGSLSAVKRYDKFLDIIAMVAATFPDVKVELVGDGPELQSLEAKAKESGLSSTIRFAGKLTRKDALNEMRKSRILLHTSEMEGMGYIFPEAAACSCYIASTPVGIVTADDFTFVSESNSELAGQICLWLSQIQAAPARSRYTISDTANSYQDIYAKLIVV